MERQSAGDAGTRKPKEGLKMSRIGKKPIGLPQGVKYSVEGSVVTVEGPKGKMEQVIPAGIKLETKDGHVHAVRENDAQAAIHGLTRALISTRWMA